MTTLYVENVPEELYTALRRRARKHRKSIAAEVLSLLEENVPTQDELRVRQKLWKRARRLRAETPLSAGPFPSTEEMQRADRNR
jgi:plasmid stability protein